MLCTFKKIVAKDGRKYFKYEIDYDVSSQSQVVEEKKKANVECTNPTSLLYVRKGKLTNLTI